MNKKLGEDYPIGNKIAPILFGSLFLVTLFLVSLTFFAPKKFCSKVTLHLEVPDSIVWKALTDKNLYKKTRPELSKFVLYDSIKPRWVEYFTLSDSVVNETIRMTPKSQWSYCVKNLKYEQVNYFNYLIVPNNHETTVFITENSSYLNIWARVYFGIFNKNAAIKFEELKLKNNIQYIVNQHK
jgi:hypothetical protein